MALDDEANRADGDAHHPHAGVGRTLMSRRTLLAPETVFLVIGVAAGVLFIVVTPPLRGADELAHWYRAYQVGHGGSLSTAVTWSHLAVLIFVALFDGWAEAGLGRWARGLLVVVAAGTYALAGETAAYPPSDPDG
jgi:hypothetical protein